MLKFVGPLIAVDEIARSRYFYEQILGQKVKDDFGVNVSFEGNFAIHLKAHYQSLLGDVAQYPIAQKAHNGELYFETDELEPIYQRLKQANVEFIHVIREQPWGQWVLRLYDPDGHVVEIGEMMEATVERLYRQGLSIEQIIQKSSMSREFVEHVIHNLDKVGQVPVMNEIAEAIG